MTNDELELRHHGIKGQRWGIRRFQNKDGSLKAAGKRRYNTEETSEGTTAEKKSSSSKTIKNMSDDDLTKAINRLRMEQTYKELISKQNPSKNSRVKKFIADMADKTARSLTEKAINEAADRFAKSLKPKEVSKITDFKFDDISKVSDKTLNDAVERTKKMTTYLNNMDALNDPDFRRQLAKSKK